MNMNFVRISVFFPWFDNKKEKCVCQRKTTTRHIIEKTACKQQQKTTILMISRLHCLLELITELKNYVCSCDFL